MQIEIMEKPQWVSWDEIHSVLYAAHSDKKKDGGIQITANYSGEELKKKVGNGMCFVATIDGRIVGTASVIIRRTNLWFNKGESAYYMLDAVLPAYQGLRIYSSLNEARDNYVNDKGIRVIYTYTAHNNKKMKCIKIKQGYRLVAFSVSSKTEYYSVIMARWLSECPFPRWYCSLRYLVSMLSVVLKYKKGAIKRF